MKKLIIALSVLVAFMATGTSCSNEAKHKYETQKAVVDSIQKERKQHVNGAILEGGNTDVTIAKLKYYHEETIALDSLKNLAKEAFGDNSAEYKEAYDQYIKAQNAEENATTDGMKSLRNYTRGL